MLQYLKIYIALRTLFNIDARAIMHNVQVAIEGLNLL